MILVIGPMGAGKREYVKRQLGYSDVQIAAAELDGRPVLADAHLLVHEYALNELLPALLGKDVVICNEVGSGVVPAEPEERDWREAAGRLSCRLAKEAQAVVRVYYGIATVLKGRI